MPSKLFSIATQKGGRNGIDPPMLIPDDQLMEAMNVDWYKGAICRKRPGSDLIPLSGGSPVSGSINAMFRFVPAGATFTASELWLIDNAGVFHRMAGGTTLADVTPKDVISGGGGVNATGMRGQTFNGKEYFLYANAAGRPAVWDGTNLRRVGLGAPSSAPTSVLAGGAVTDTRTYQSAVTVQSSGVTIRRSELSPISGSVVMSSQQTTETLTGAPGEGETNWELYGASTDNVYKLIGTAAIGSTIVDNNALLTGTLSPLAGTNALFPDAVLIAADGSNRLLMAQHRTNTALSSRIWYTPIFAFPGDDERLPAIVNQNNYFDINQNDGDFITALAGPLQGSLYAYKNQSTWKLTPTGDFTAPYSVLRLSGTIGCISDKCVVQATDEYGQPCICWISQQGPYRIGSQGLQYMGRDIEDLWPIINLGATIPAHGVFYPQLHQIWWWLTLNTDTDPSVLVVFDTILGHAVYYTVGDVPPTAGVRRGWARWSGDLAKARCSVMYSRIIGASMGVLTRPYAGFIGNAARLLGADSVTAMDDGGTPFQGYILTKAYQPVGRDTFFEGTQPLLQAKASPGAIIQLRATCDWGAQPVITDTIVLTATDTESRVWRKFERIMVPRARTMQFQIGDPNATVSSWELDEFVMPITALDPMS
jgi:hypothetical protein